PRPPPRAGSDRVRPPGADLLGPGHVRPDRRRVGRDLDGLRGGPPARGPSAPADGVDSGGARDGAAAVPGGDLARLRIDGAVIAALLCIALTAHLVPLTVSPLPLSVDGFALARISRDMASAGSWRIDPANVNSYNQKLPGYSLLWSAVFQVAGLSPLVHAQLVLPLVTAAVVLPAYLLGVKATGRRIAGLAAGLFIALFGSFLLLTSSVAKESIGLLVFPMAVLLFHERSDPRKRLLTALIAPIAKPAKRRLGKGLVRPASKIFLPPVLGFFVLITNSTIVLFVGTIRTPPAFFLILPALFGFAAFAIVGLQMVRRTT